MIKYKELSPEEEQWIREYYKEQERRMSVDIDSLIRETSNRCTLKIKKLNPDAVIPTYATDGSAGLDLTAVTEEWLSGSMIKYGTGLALEIPTRHVGLLFPRSSIYKTKQTLTNCVGVIDSDYRGEISAIFRHRDDLEKIYSIGERIMQLVIVPIPQIDILVVDELSTTDRGAGGFGSTGK